MSRTSPSLHPPRAVPEFDPVRAGHGRHRLRHALRGGRRPVAAGLTAVTAGLAVAAAALAASPARGGGPGEERTAAGGAATGSRTAAGARMTADSRTAAEARAALSRTVSAPLRIPDAATVRLLEPGDRIDVIASGNRGDPTSTSAHFVARNVRVAQVPESDDTVAGDGALVVVAVSRKTATELAGAAATSRLAVTLC